MNILINCSNLRAGGGLQVGDSICRSLNEFGDHKFVAVLSSSMDFTAHEISNYDNVVVIRHDIKNDFKTLVLGRDKVLDDLVKNHSIDSVLTVFGPSRWNPKVPHLCGFARAQLIMPDSPYYKNMSLGKLLSSKFFNSLWNVYFKRGSEYFYTENPLSTELLKQKWPHKKIYTVTNYYNQVFDTPSSHSKYVLPDFSGTTLLSVTSSGAWKNLNITKQISKILKSKFPDFKFRFVMTVKPGSLGEIDEDISDNFLFISKVDITELPALYEQSDIMFQPTLLECFTATYPEAMRMRKPIVTTDLPFARGLCGDAAAYYSPIDPESAASMIYKVATDSNFASELVENGVKQLQNFDTYEGRVRKLISLCETIASDHK